MSQVLPDIFCAFLGAVLGFGPLVFILMKGF